MRPTMLLVAALLAASAWRPASADALSPEALSPGQRAEVVAILRDALTRDPSILRDAVTAMQADDTRREAAARQAAIAARKADLVTAADPVAGNPNGDVTIIEFFDIRCPYCHQLEPQMAALIARDRNIRLVYKDLPILGPASVLGARALLAAQRQGAYEPMRAALMREGPPPTEDSVRAEAQRLGLDLARLERDLHDAQIEARIDANLSLAKALGIHGTPAMVVGGELVPGAVSVADLQTAVAQARRGG